MPAESAHYLAMDILKAACSVPFIKNYLRKQFSPIKNPVDSFGLRFRNRTGLGAGFDKNAKYLHELEVLGFGFVEIGTVTPKPQSGNNKPRLFRLKEDEALINRMGFNNDGVEIITDRLKRWRKQESLNCHATLAVTTHLPRYARSEESQLTGSAPLAMTIGGNIGKNKSTANEDAWKDYETCFLALHPFVDFFVVNVSSPNTPGLRELQEKDALKKILTHLQQLNGKQSIRRPILLKIAPDLTDGQLDDVIALAKEINLEGIVASNTTISRERLQTTNSSLRAKRSKKLQTIGAGGLSGKPLKIRSTEVIRYIHGRAPGIPIIGSGGIFTKEDAEEKLKAGATLVEVWTGFIYEGPMIVKNIT